jgi:hypothetical protein
MGVLYNSIPSSSVTLSGSVIGAVSPQKGDAIGGRTYLSRQRSATSGGANAIATVFTPTAGKTAYITDMIVGGDSASFWRIGDALAGNAWGNPLTPSDSFGAYAAANFVIAHHFATPLKIATTLDIQFYTATVSHTFCFVGWEE